MNFSRFHYAIIQSTTVLVAVGVAFSSPRPRAKAAAPPTHDQPKALVTPVDPAAREVAKEEGASFVTEIEFARGTFTLSPEGRSKLGEAITRASAKRPVAKIQLIVWADEEYPVPHRSPLPRTQIRLADRRAKAINEYLKSRAPRAITDAFNMAERPGVLQTLLPTGDARIKRTLEATQANSAASYAAKAVVLFLIDPEI